MEIRPGIHTYEFTWEKWGEDLGFVVVEAEGETLLFGTGVEGMANELGDVVERHGVSVAVVEHGDRDHYEGAPVLRERHGVRVAVPAGDADRLEAAGVEPDVLLTLGETYWGVETISVPGHTPDNAAYLVDDVLIAGDTVLGADSGFAADGPWSGPLAVITGDFNEDDEQARASVSRLLDHDFDAVLVAHGSNVLEGGRAAVETLVEDLAV